MSKREIIIRIILVVFGLLLGFGLAFSIEFCQGNKLESFTVLNVENESGIRLRQNKMATDTDRISITAEVLPANAIDKTVSWSWAWGSSNSGNVADYVTITPSADTLTCTVKVKKAFTTQIILTCTANSNSTVKATCTIDYVRWQKEEAE